MELEQPKKPIFTKKVILGLTIILALVSGLFVGGARLFDQGASVKRAFVTERESDYIYGEKSAPVRFIFYGDASCQYCRALYPQLKALIDTYPDKAALIYRHRPIYDKGYDSTAVVDMLVAECVGEQGGSDAYYTYIDTLYKSIEDGVRSTQIPFSIIESAAAEAGVALETITSCTGEVSRVENIFTEREQLRIFGARVVPYTFIFVGEEMYEVSGNKPITVYQEFIEWFEKE